MQLIVPMAGLGSRYSEAGYTTPKPLIPVGGLPMVVRVVNDLPTAERIVFLVHPEHVRQHRIDSVLQTHFPNATVVQTPGLTEGQACTVRLAADAVDPHQPVLVAACDATHLYSRRYFEAFCAEPTVEAMIWTYRREYHVLSSPESYGWVRTRGDGLDVAEVSCKRPISGRPLEDHVVSGFFWFRTAGGLFSAIDCLVEEGRQIRGEYYLDVVPNILVNAGHRVIVFEVDKYIGWGTPNDLQNFQRWQQYFLRSCGTTLVGS